MNRLSSNRLFTKKKKRTLPSHESLTLKTKIPDSCVTFPVLFDVR